MGKSRFASVSRSTTDRGTLVSVVGELDAASGAQLRLALGTALARGGTIDIDLSGVTFADSAGLSAVEAPAECAKEFGIDLRVVATSIEVERCLSMASGAGHDLPHAQPA